jgi:hypothetical protein
MRLESRTKRRLAALLSLVSTALFALFYFRSGSRVPEPVSPAASVHTAERAWRTNVVASPPGPRRARTEPEPAPIVDQVSVEKSTVCAGEENLLRIKAHTVNGTDAYLHYVVDGHAGNPVPLRFFRADDGPMPARKITVFGRGNVATTVDVPEVRVNDCGDFPLVMVRHRLLANSDDQYQLSVRLSHAPKDFRAEAYEWDFGDGSSQKTAEPIVRHAYEPKARGIYVRFLVDVAVVSAEGKRLRGRSALELLNRAEQVRLERGVVLIQAELTPRFPVVDADGTLHQRVRLFHQADEAVTIHGIVLERSGSQQSREKVEPGAVLGSASIPPGRGLEVEFTLPKRDPHVGALTYSLQGRAGASPARGAFSLMWPPEPPTREHSEPVTSPELKAKIVGAQRILGKPFVTAEEIHELESRGALQASSNEGAQQRRF